MKKLFLFICLSGFLCCSNRKRQVKLVPLFPYERTLELSPAGDSLKIKYYFIEDYETYEEDSSVIDKLIVEALDKNYKTYHNLEIRVYEKSSKVNEDFHDVNVNALIDQNEVLHFIWDSGHFYSLDVLRNNVEVRSYFKKGSEVFNSTAEFDFFDFGPGPSVILEEVKNP